MEVLMIKELDTIVLAHDRKEHGLVAGDVGAVVHVYKDNTTYEVEFIAADGRTVALITLGKSDIRPINGREILHVRELQAA